MKIGDYVVTNKGKIFKVTQQHNGDGYKVWSTVGLEWYDKTNSRKATKSELLKIRLLGDSIVYKFDGTNGEWDETK